MLKEKFTKTIVFDKDVVIEFTEIAKSQGLLFTQAVKQAMTHYMNNVKKDK